MVASRMTSSQSLMTDAFRLHASKFMKVSSLSILAYDYGLTMEREIDLMWGTDWGIARILFCLARYLPFVDASVYHYYAFATLADPDGYEDCTSLYYAAMWLDIFGICAAEGLLILRTFAMWKCNKKILLGLLVLAAAPLSVALVLEVKGAGLLSYGPAPEPGVPGCYETRSNDLLYAFFLLLVVFETVVLGLTAYRASQQLRQSSGPLMRALYVDSIINLLCLLLNVIVMKTIPPSYDDVFETFPGTMHSVISSRIMFNLRESARCDVVIEDAMMESTEEDHAASVRFSSRITIA
ncbi:hypothetical protein F5I97DRAFT_1150618 [Phlebopus sp. FC_14]|nr:hypothetical protein F5I97DRAFT_1150618 [Phlebopus sp. FC_14]